MPTRILLVEDNPGDAVIFREKLNASDLDFELVHAKRLGEGLDHLRGAHFDIMMVDLSLPDAQGMEAVVKVRQEAPDRPLIVLTGLDDATAAAEAKKQGAVDYLVKWYVDSVSLARYIRYAIAQYRMYDDAPGTQEDEAPQETPVEGRAVPVAAEPSAGPFRAVLEASTEAVLIVTEERSVVFANAAARAWVEGDAYPWPVEEGVRRIPRKGQALEQRAASTRWQERPAFLVTLGPARPPARPAPPKPEPEQTGEAAEEPAAETLVRAAEAALSFVARAERQSAWIADVMRSALDLYRTRPRDLQPDLVDVLDLANQAVREQRALAMQQGLPLRVRSQRKKVIAYADRNLVKRMLQRIVVDAVQSARHDGVKLRADVEGELSVLEAQWHEPGTPRAEDGHAALGRRLVERLAELAGGTFAHDLDVTGQHTVTVRLPGRPTA